MVTFLITSVLFLGLIAIAIYFWQKPAHKPESIELPPPPRAAGLFADQDPEPSSEVNFSLLLVEKAGTEPDEKDDLKTRKIEAEQFIASWQESPDRNSTAKMVHLAALVDDADTYRETVELVLRLWQRGSIPDLSADELQALFNSEFWLLSSRTRNSGAGFVLKRTLSRAKRELENVNNPT